jgi:hypothetical protein
MKLVVWVHDQSYSQHELIGHSELFTLGEFVTITFKVGKRDPTELHLQVTQIDTKPLLQISISQHIASLFDIPPRSHCFVKKIRDIESIGCHRMEIAFRDQYIGRADMWQLKQSLLHSSVYVGKKVQSLGVRGHIRSLDAGQSSGLCMDHTRFIFRSETAKFFIFLQMSKEMWEFDEDGDMFFEKCVYGFLPELFSRWKQVGTNHVVSIVMFARVYFPLYHADCLRDHQGRYYKDFYHVLVDWETRQDWSVILTDLKKEFSQFQRDILQLREQDGSSVLSGQNSTFKEGNVLEAINVALNPFDKHYIDRDLSRTGLSIVIITPGTGIFEVDKRLCRMTTQRMIDNGISLDLICLSKPPLHATPLFLFQSKEQGDSPAMTEKNPVSRAYSDLGARGYSEKSDKSERGVSELGKSEKSMMDHLYMDDDVYGGETVSVYMIPDWMDCSYWTRSTCTSFVPRCKMYEIQMTGLMERQHIMMPHLDLFEDDLGDPTLLCEAYDHGLFASKIIKKGKPVLEEEEEEEDVKLGTSISRSFTSGWTRKEWEESKFKKEWEETRTRKERKEEEHVYSTSMEPIRIRRVVNYREADKGSCSTDSRGASPIPDYLRSQVKFSPSKTPTKQTHFLRHNYVNPFSFVKQTKVGINDRRWEHIPKWISHDGNQFFTNWTSLCSPACLPLTIEYFPSPEELSEFYQEYTYTISPANESQIESLLVELISQRLAQGFQLIVSSATVTGKPLLGKNHLISISKPYFLCLGDHVHRLFYDSSGNNIEVKRYTRRVTYNTDPIGYTCAIWSKNTLGYQTRNVTFSYPALSTYNWNYLDHLISGYQDELTDALRFWRIRFLLIPLEHAPSPSHSNLLHEQLDEEEERLLGFQKFMEMIEKTHVVKSEGKKRQGLDIQYTTLNLSSLVKSEDMHVLLPEAFLSTEKMETVKPVELLNRTVSMDRIAKQLISPPPIGLPLQDRHWHSEIFEHVATGEEIVDWILSSFSDMETREQALELGNQLIEAEVLEHVMHKHRMLDGFYFYRLCPQWLSKMDPQSRPVHARKRFQAVKSIPLDLDPQKKSKRQEIALLHYDTTHNTKNCYHFQLHWLVCTARLVEELMHSWTRMAEKTGFKLVEAPGGQVSLSGDDNPFQALFPISLALPPPSLDTLTTHSNLVLPKEHFEREFVKSFHFILDTESDKNFPLDSRGYSYQRKPWPHTQYVHRSGIAFLQILGDASFVWVNNRLYMASQKSTTVNPDSVREEFERACQDKEGLRRFWDTCVARVQELAELKKETKVGFVHVGVCRVMNAYWD